MWIPDSKAIFPDLLATSGDYLRVWRAGEPETRLECLLNNNKNSDFCAPLTSFDWNEVDPNLLGINIYIYNYLALIRFIDGSLKAKVNRVIFVYKRYLKH